jgi:hypothetical protein
VALSGNTLLKQVIRIPLITLWLREAAVAVGFLVLVAVLVVLELVLGFLLLLVLLTR